MGGSSLSLHELGDRGHSCVVGGMCDAVDLGCTLQVVVFGRCDIEFAVQGDGGAFGVIVDCVVDV